MTKLRGGEVAQISSAEAMEDIDYVRLKEEGRLSVDEVECGGGAPPSDPVEGAFKSGGPWRKEHAERILLHRRPFCSVVVLVLPHHLVHHLLIVLILQPLHHLLQLLEPSPVKLCERSVHCVELGNFWFLSFGLVIMCSSCCYLNEDRV